MLLKILLKITLSFFLIIIFVESSFAKEYKDEVSASVTINGEVTSVTGRWISNQNSNWDRLVFIMEGFDVHHGDGSDDEIDLDYLEDQLIYEGLKRRLLNHGYDVVLVNFDDNWHSIDYTAYAFGNLIQKFWQASLQIEPVKLIGMSMGGLVSVWTTGIKSYFNQYGGASSDIQAIINKWTFKINLVNTFDTPHRGAYIPFSIQSWVHYFHDAHKFEDEAGIQQMKNAFTGTAATQLLVLSKASPGQGYWPHDGYAFMDAHENVLSYLSQQYVSNEPIEPGVKIAGIVNGCWNGVRQIPNNYQLEVINWHYDPAWCGEVWSRLWSEGEGGVRTKVLYANFDACGFGKPKKDYYWTNWQNFENAPGGYRPSYAALADALEGKSKPTPAHDQHCFVPTFSAAALEIYPFAYNDRDNFKSWETNFGIELEETLYCPLHKIYHHDDNNEEHVEFTTTNKGWILQELYNRTIAGTNPLQGSLRFVHNGKTKMLIESEHSDVFLEGVTTTNLNSYSGLKFKYKGDIEALNDISTGNLYSYKGFQCCYQLPYYHNNGLNLVFVNKFGKVAVIIASKEVSSSSTFASSGLIFSNNCE